MKEIMLTNGRVALVDDEDYERINANQWSARFNKCTRSYYAVRSSLTDANGQRRTILMHREVMDAKPGELVDHLNHDTLDNQKKSNLRICTLSQNMSNRRMRTDNKSGYKGVTLKKPNRKWAAQLMANGKQRHIGYFATALEAALAYDQAALELHGEFALTNRMLGLLPK